jgi:tRNA threonylcarbamoyladenosine biosynthesis protein TsaE
VNGPSPAERIESTRVDDPAAMHDLGRIGAALTAGDLVVLTGPLGAGKTTLTAGLGEALGVRGPVTSPTFVLARTHPSLVGGPPLVHVDAYRLGSAAELDDLDLDYEHAVVVVEWGEGLLDGVSESLLQVVLAPSRHGRHVASRRAGTGVEGPRPRSDAAPDDDVPIEPRTVELRRTGPRWADAPPLLG